MINGSLSRALRRSQSCTEYSRTSRFAFSKQPRQGKTKRTTWTPQPGPQTLALESLADDTYYGGAAGGGKTDGLLGIATSAHERSLIFRKHFKDLSWLEERARQILGPGAAFNGTAHRYRWDGKLLEFGSLQHPNDWEKWQGVPHDFLGVDEVTQHVQRVIRTLVAWNRTATPGQRVRAMYTFNPPTTVEGQWILDVLRPWLDPSHPNPALPGELRWFAVVDGKDVEVEGGSPFEHTGPTGEVETIYPRSRTFIPAKLSDNVYYNRDPQYRASLQSLPEPLRSQMLYGDMAAGVKDNEWQIIPTAWIDEAMQRWRERQEEIEGAEIHAVGVDVARSGDDRTAFSDWSILDDGVIAVRLETHAGAATPSGQAVVEILKEHVCTVREVEERGEVREEVVYDEVPATIDVVGVGASPYDIARDADLRIYGINAAGGTKEKSRGGRFGFTNVRALMYWRLREMLDPEGDYLLALPPNRELRAELAAHRYEVTPRGVRVREKDEVRETVGRSPDLADAVALGVLAVRKVL